MTMSIEYIMLLHWKAGKSIESSKNYDTCDDFKINSIKKPALLHHYIMELVLLKTFVKLPMVSLSVSDHYHYP